MISAKMELKETLPRFLASLQNCKGIFNFGGEFLQRIA